MKRFLSLLLCLVLATPACLFAQTTDEQVDSLVSLLSAKRLKQLEINGVPYRKVEGPARFLHNNTYLDCDSALWNLNTDIIDAIGNVRILQNETVLKGDSLKYIVDQDVAQFRGHLVELQDKDRNILRTRFLDYNTKDSVATFYKGGAMKDKDGQIIESLNGRYDSKLKYFSFTDDVNMFTDSIFVKTTRLEYLSETGLAIFGRSTNAWKDDNMLSSEGGWYRREDERFLFYDNVHAMSPDKEAWADSLYYNRLTGDLEMLGHVQMSDSLRQIHGLAGHADYVDSLMLMTLTRDAAIVGVTDSTGTARDSVWIGADKFVYRTQYLGDIPGKKASADKRLEDISTDAIADYREKMAEEARKAAEEAAQKAAENDPNIPPDVRAAMKAAGVSMPDEKKEETPPEKPGGDPAMPPPPVEDVAKNPAPADSLARPAMPDSLGLPETLALPAKPDSLGLPETLALRAPEDSIATSLPVAASADSLAGPPPVDSTKIGFLTAVGNIRMYREDIQIACDSLEYCDLDSLVRMYDRPLVWNEGNRQYAADSIIAVIHNSALEKANLLSEAFIIIQEDTIRYDQIRSAEMMAYFGEGGDLTRFDALGGADAIFYLKEDSTLATVSKSTAKLMTANFKDGSIEDVYYYDNAKIDAYPLAQMKTEDRTLKGFEWQPEGRPSGPRDITSRTIRPGERREYSRRPRATFVQSSIYFPGYLQGIYKEISDREAAARDRARMKDDAAAPGDSLAIGPDIFDAGPDSLGLRPDSLMRGPLDSLGVRPDSLMRGSLDSLAVAADSLSRPLADSLAVAADSVSVPPADPRQQKQAEREAKRRETEAKTEARIAAREEKWARLDSLDAEKARVKEEKAAAKLRKKKLAALQRQQKQDEKDLRRKERYMEKYLRKKAKKDERAAAKAKEALPPPPKETLEPEEDTNPPEEITEVSS